MSRHQPLKQRPRMHMQLASGISVWIFLDKKPMPKSSNSASSPYAMTLTARKFRDYRLLNWPRSRPLSKKEHKRLTRLQRQRAAALSLYEAQTDSSTDSLPFVCPT